MSIKENRMTPETAQFLLNLVNGLTLTVGGDDFDAALGHVLDARKALTAVIETGEKI